MKDIIQKLDLDGYIHQFEQFFARVKPVSIQWDESSIVAISKPSRPSLVPVGDERNEKYLMYARGN